MIVQGLLKIIQKFEKTGAFHVQSGKCKKKIDLIVVEVATAEQEESSSGVKPCSARGIARTCDRPVSIVHKILRNILHCYRYKIDHVKEFFFFVLPSRERFETETFALEFVA